MENPMTSNRKIRRDSEEGGDEKSPRDSLLELTSVFYGD